MAIYHLSVKVISRANGSSALAAAAYRSASRLHDDRLDRDHNFSNKTGVVHSEVLLPDNAPDEWHDRERLWNDVEAAELRKDAQLAREVEFAIPREMTREQGIELARDFVSAEFVDRGMVADLNVHWDIGADGEPKPHAHVMLSMREITDESGFGAKVRDWNRTDLVERWRERWAEHVNQRLAELDIDARIDHRSFRDRGIDLEPQGKIGAPAQRMERDGQLANRAEIHREIARDNGARIIADPSLGLDQITHGQATFTRRDMAIMAHRHSDGVEQFNDVMAAMRGAPELVALGVDGRGEERFTTREMIETEQRLEQAARMMAEREHHRVADRDRERALARAVERELVLSGEQADALAHVTQGPDLGVVVGYAGTGKSAMLGVAREAWEDAGYNVRGAALSGIAAEGLENGSGIGSRTIASLEHQWERGRDLLTANDILVIDEAGMVGTRQMERVLDHAAEAGAKVVLVGDPEQLQAIEAGAAFRAIHERHGGVEITEVRRQRVDWQRDATRHLATGRTGEALQAYDDHGMVHAAGSRDEARKDLIDRWDRDRQASPGDSRIILTHTNEEVGELNAAARERMREMGGLGDDVRLTVNRGERDFARGDRILFLRNEHGLGVKNGTLGTIEEVSRTGMTVRTDSGRAVSFDHKDYADVDHGYAATIHKTQSMTVDRVHVLATPGMDAHASYVALSRHRDRVDVHYGGDDFADRERLTRTLSRDRAKDMASDYERVDPERAFAERRGITLRERIAEVVRKVPDKVRGMFDGLRLAVGSAREVGHRTLADKPAPREPELSREPPPDPDEVARRIRTEALKRHGRAYDAVFGADRAGKGSPDQLRELDDARAAFEKVRPFGPRDAEAAYAKDPAAAADVVRGSVNRAILALQAETELRLNADQFVRRWQGLEAASQRHYELGDMDAYKAMQRRMGDMAMGLQRDPQLESVLAIRKAELGITISSGRSLGAELAYNHGIDIGLGRGRGLGL
ncbi:Ti-type conjugative transfer relaxase TraA [Sphingomonas sp. MMSM20]|uniref:Ti-type conjugative transfer relaxase TraA n=1 Tax=Sphingomonas lycopersici TaxID=2951807 RepID=UPI00223901B5|nr:Ti-type conjugative transfer relaxase TraA [Sphingomonas lycopersici]MCW6532509.1 Ti-type conjugative transfer relaxase TraA [Sphingomonas lycopersici]